MMLRNPIATKMLRLRVLSAAVLLSASPLQRSSTRAEQRIEPALEDLQTIDDLRDAFNRDTGSVRLVLLLSPT